MTGIVWPAARELPQLPFKRLFRPVKRPPLPGAPIVTAYTDGQVTLRANRAKVGYHEASDTSTYLGVRKGDFVVHGLDIMRGSVGVSDSDGVISPVCTVCLPTALVEPRYVAYAIRVQAASGFPKALARGVREGGADFRRWDTLAELPIPVPALDAQRAIADYLDRETAQIDAFIAKNEELITLLTERRKSAVTQLVLGDRGLETTGAGTSLSWSRGPLKRYLKLHDGQRIPLSSLERAARPGEYDYYGASGVIDRVDGYLFDQPRVLVSEDGANLLLRSSPIAFTAQGKYWVNNHAHVLEPIDGDVDFWSERIEAEDVGPFVTGSAQPKLTAEALMNLVVTAPAPSEQRIIARSVRLIKQKADKAIDVAHKAIRLARERRAALISAAVTGKIDVGATA